MAFLASCQEIGKAYAARPLFRGITLGINEGERIGLIGPNGAGKSTLLKLLAGLEKPDAGAVSLRRGLRLGYVAQEDDFPAGPTVEQVLSGALRSEALNEHEQATRVSRMLGRAGFGTGDQAVVSLSGGWKKRLALARELIREPDLLLVDEPTNHLDLEGILWLERLLREVPSACVLATHDRYFLQSVATRIVELNAAYAEGYLSVDGAYADFLGRRADYLQAQAHHEQALANRVRREVEWLRQGAQARSTKEGARIRQAGRLMDELAELRFRNSADRTAGIDFDATGRKTRELLTARGVGKSLGGHPLFTGLDLVLSPGVKLGLIGPNGSGKTTLLRLLAGEVEPDTGSIRRADGLRVVYYDQAREQLDLDLSLRRSLAPAGDTVVYRGGGMHVAAWAKRFLFPPEHLEMSLRYLSGGERARVLIARLMLQPADLLILDEPANDLDLGTLDVLEESLRDFPGALVLVTHDRYMLDRVSTEVLALDGRGGARFFADYHQWERARDEAALARPAARESPRNGDGAPVNGIRRLTTAEQRELSRMEARIEAAEAETAALQAELADPEVGRDPVRVQNAWSRLEAAQEKVAGLYARWEELEAKKVAGA